MSNSAHELFLLSTNLSQYKSKVLIQKIFIESINSLFIDHDFYWSEEFIENTEERMQVCTRIKTYGYINFNKQSKFTDETFSLLQNAAQWLGILFEKLEQESLLNDQKKYLSYLVEEKTKDLVESQKKLEIQKSEIEEQNEALKISKEKAEKSEIFFRIIFENSPVGKSITLIDGTIKTNKAFSDMLGYSFEEFQLKNYEEITHPDDIYLSKNAVNELLEGKYSSFHFEKRYLHKDGSIVYTEVRTTIQKDSNGIPLFFITNIIDITERKNAELLLQAKTDEIEAQNEEYLQINEELQQINIELQFAKECAEESERNLSVVFNNTHDLQLLLKVNPDNQLQVVAVNQQYLNVVNAFGYNATREIIEGRTIEHLLSEFVGVGEDVLKKTLDHYYNPVNTGLTEKYEEDLETPGGHYYAEITITPVLNKEGKCTFLLWNSHNVSVQKHAEQLLQEKNEEIEAQNEEYLQINEELQQINIELQFAKEKAEESEENLKFLFENMIQGVVYHDTTGKIIQANEAAARILGLTLDQMSGKTSLDPRWKSFHEDGTDYPGNTHPVMITLQTHQPVRNSIMGIIIPEKDEYSWININSIPKFNDKDELIQVIVTFEDITDIKKAKEKAEESDRLKTAFLQNMSHEIRTPMNAIMGFSSLLPENFNNLKKLQNFSNIINQRCSDLLDIITDILDISKIESGQSTVNIDECNLNELLSELELFFRDYQNRTNKQHIEFTLKPPDNESDFIFKTDKVKLKQILINLISNAFKFTEKGSVKCGVTQANNKLQFSVSDTGLGIPTDKFDFIFERFAQLKNTTIHNSGGNGLGLPIVKGLVGLLGGEVWLQSECDKGSTFYFTIDYAQADSTNGKKLALIDKQEIVTDKTILIVEDDYYNAEYLKEVLRNISSNIIIATNGLSAVKIVQEQKIDIILMDIRLPDINGYETTRLILEQKPDIKIIAQTAYAANVEHQKATDAGCVDYISKPTKQEQLLSLMNKYLI